MKKFIVKPIFASLADVGLSIYDDGLLFQFMYDWYKVWHQLPTYDEVLEVWDSSVTEDTYGDATERLGNALPYVKYYVLSDSEKLIELLNNPIESRIDIPENILQQYGDEVIGDLYLDKIDWAVDRFEVKSDTNLELLGQNGQHVCVADTVNNALSYMELKALAEQLADTVVGEMNNLTDEDITSWLQVRDSEVNY